MCRETVNEEGDGVRLTALTFIDPKTFDAVYDIGFTVECCRCGASVGHEYREEAIRLWNGEPPPADEDEESAA
jgi:hypothetical protein